MFPALNQALMNLFARVYGTDDAIEVFIRGDGLVYVFRHVGDARKLEWVGEVSMDRECVTWRRPDAATPAPGKEP